MNANYTAIEQQLAGKVIESLPWTDGRKPLLACCLECAETVAHLWPKESVGSITTAIETLRQWIGGNATTAQAQQARRDLWTAVGKIADIADTYTEADAEATEAAYAAYAAGDAAYATAYAADVANTTGTNAATNAPTVVYYVTSVVSTAAYAAAYAAGDPVRNAVRNAVRTNAADPAADAARASIYAQCANIVRKHFPAER